MNRNYKGKRTERHLQSTIMVFLILTLTLFSLSLVSAMTFDNVKSYDKQMRMITIENGFGLGGNVAKIKLISPQNIKVGLGYNKVAEFNVTYYLDSNGGLDLIEFYDIHNKMNKIERTFDYKVKVVKQIKVNDYKTICKEGTYNKTSLNYTENCLQEIVGSHLENKSSWEDLDISSLEKGKKYTIGIFTDVKKEDYVEWIPIYYGVRIREWASWEEVTNFSDTFTRANSATVGNAEIGGGAWTESEGGGTAEISSNTLLVTDTSGSNNVALTNTFSTPDITPERFKLKIKLQDVATDYYIIYLKDGATSVWAIEMGIGSGVKIQGGNTIDTMTSGAYKEIEFKNINFTTHTYDVWSDGVEKLVAEPFANNQNGLDSINMNTGGSQTGVINIDYINLSTLISVPSPPNVTLNSPIDNYNSSSSDITFNCSASDDSNLINVSLYIDGVINETNSSGINNTNYIFTKTLSDGSYNWTCEATNDINLTTTASYRDFSIDTTPLIQFETPTYPNNTNTNTNYLPINVSLTETYFDNVTFYLYNSTDLNRSITFSNSTRDYNFTGLTDGTYYLNATIWTTTNQHNSTETRKYSIDTILPLINVTSPTGTYNYLYENYNLTLNLTATDANLDTCWFNYNGTNTTLGCVSATLGSYYFNYEKNMNNLTIYANDTSGHLNSSLISWNYLLLLHNETYASSTLEGISNLFKIVFETNGTAITVSKLNYNETNYTGSISSSGNIYTLTKNITAPAINTTTNNSFYWYAITSPYTQKISSKNQTINPIIINSTCSGMNVIYNFTLKDELTQTKLNTAGNNTFIKLYLQLYDDGRLIKLIDFHQEYSQINPVVICINNTLNSNERYSMDIQIQYKADNYATETYNFEREVLDATKFNQNISLYDLILSKSQVFKLIVRNSAYLPIKNALIKIERQYLENGTFYVTEAPKSDTLGYAVASLEINKAIYNFYIYQNGNLINSFLNVYALCQTPTITECNIDFASYQNGIKIPDYTTANDFNFTLSYNATTRIVSSLFVIPSGEPSTIKLEVIREDALGTSICTDTLTSDSGTLNCVVPSSFGNSTIRAKLYKNNVEQGWGNIKLDQKSKDIFGVILIFLSVLVMMTLIGVGISDNPVITGVFIFIGVILMFSINLVQNTGFFGATSSILFLAIAIILVIIKAGRRT